MIGAGFGALRHRGRRYRTVCKGEVGRIRNFSGRQVCELSDINKISKITQLTEEGDTKMLATLEDDKKIYTEPITLNKFKQKVSVEKRCYGNFCEFEKIR